MPVTLIDDLHQSLLSEEYIESHRNQHRWIRMQEAELMFRNCLQCDTRLRISQQENELIRVGHIQQILLC